MRKLDLYLPFRKKYRSHFEIIASMLEAVKDISVGRFSLMKYANINCAQLKKYLGSLTEMGLIEVNIKEGQVLYSTSDKGLTFLKQYYVLLGMLLSKRAKSYSIMMTQTISQLKQRAR